jgi:hypothetical protein
MMGENSSQNLSYKLLQLNMAISPEKNKGGKGLVLPTPRVAH